MNKNTVLGDGKKTYESIMIVLGESEIHDTHDTIYEIVLTVVEIFSVARRRCDRHIYLFFFGATPWPFLPEDMFSIFASYTVNMPEWPCMF